MIKAIIFDLGGTLVYYPPPEKFAALCRTEEIRRITSLPQSVLAEISDEIIKQRRESKKTLKEYLAIDVFRNIFRKYKIGVDKADSVAEMVYAQYASKSRLYPDVKDALRGLRRRGYLIGLISNTIFPRQWHLRELEKFRLDRFFKVIIWSSDFGWRKPHPSIFQHGLKLLKVKPEEAIYVGNELVPDILGSQQQQVGMRGVLIYRSMDQKDISLLLDTRPYRVITDLNKLVDIARRA